MPGELAWMGKRNETKVLHIRDDRHPEWTPYQRHVNRAPEYPEPSGSKGLATMHKLLKLGYKINVQESLKSHDVV